MKARKKFPCGHRGFGKFCHLCQDIADGKVQKIPGPTAGEVSYKTLTNEEIKAEKKKRRETDKAAVAEDLEKSMRGGKKK